MQVYDALKERNFILIVSEYCEYGSLGTYLEKVEYFEEFEALYLFK